MIMKNLSVIFRAATAAALMAVLFFLPSCSDNDDIDPSQIEEGFGSSYEVTLPADFSDRFPEGEAIVNFVYQTGNVPVSVKADHYVRNGRSVLKLQQHLRQGEYVVTSVQTSGPDKVQDHHMGCSVNVGASSNTVSPENYDMAKLLFGEGTSRNPYRIASETGFVMMREMFSEGKNSSKDVCFMQVADIDMTRFYNKGFVPICNTQAFPFEGYFDGRGHKISYCAVRTLDSKDAPASEAVPATGLFGYVAGATFRNVVMENPVVMGAGASGSLIGAVVGISGVDQTPTVVDNVRVRVNSSAASEVFGINFVGGIVGGIEANAVLTMTGCVNENLPVSNREDGSFVGGLVGGGTLNASVAMDSCANHANVHSYGTRCAGGIIGGVFESNISDCVNNGSVIGEDCLGTGGIAGGIGASALVAVVNNGHVSGDVGTGGIVGSTVLRKSDGTYSDVTIGSAHNYGYVEGNDNTGGIVGEAQASLSDCYNKGEVCGHGTFAGGIAGYAPVAVIHSCYNNAAVNARECAAGVVGRSSYYILTACSNLGAVTSSGMSGGILGLGGSTGMVNFCNNYGQVGGSSMAGGIVARAGDSDSLTEDDIASLVEGDVKTAYKILRALNIPPIKLPDFIVKIKKVRKVTKAARSVIDVVKAAANPLQLEDLSKWDELYDQEVPARCDEMYASMHRDVAAAIPSSGFNLSGIGSLPGAVYSNVKDFDNSLSEEDEDAYSDAIHDRLEEINSQVAAVEKAREVILAVEKCVIAVAGFVVTGPTAAVTSLVLTSAISTIGTVTQRMDNCVEVSQCCNFGTVSAGDDGFGIVARLGDHLRLYDCFNAGICSGAGIADKTWNIIDDIDIYRTLTVGIMDQKSFGNSKGDSQCALFCWGTKDGSSQDQQWQAEHGVLTTEQLADKSNFTWGVHSFDFDNQKTWRYLVPDVPTPYNNLYHSFR